LGHLIGVRWSAEPGLVCAERAREDRGGRSGAVGGDPAAALRAGLVDAGDPPADRASSRHDQQGGPQRRAAGLSSRAVGVEARSVQARDPPAVEEGPGDPGAADSGADRASWVRGRQDDRRRLPARGPAAISAGQNLSAHDLPARRDLPVRSLGAQGRDPGRLATARREGAMSSWRGWATRAPAPGR
jgi:hypothetical protein